MSLKTRIKQITPVHVVTTAAIATLGVVAGASLYNMNARTNAYTSAIGAMTTTYEKFLADSLALNVVPSANLPH